MEGISAKSLDSQEKLDPKKERAVEHLREMRDVFTPFVRKFSHLFDEGQVEYQTPDLNKPEVVSADEYRAIFYTLSGIIKPIVPHPHSSLQPIMFECMGDSDMYDLLYEQYVLTETKRREIAPLSIYDTEHIQTKEEIAPLLQAMYDIFLQELESEGMKDYFLRMSREKRTVLAKNANYGDLNSKEIKNKPMTGLAGGLDGKVSIESSEELVYGFPVGATIDKREAFSPDEVFPQIIILPIGEYGSEFTQRLFNTMQIMYSKVEVLKDDARGMVAAHEKMFKSTARGNRIVPNSDVDRARFIDEKREETGQENLKYEEDKIKEAERNYMAAILALEEGIATLAQVLSLLTANKVEGFKTGEELLKALIEQELPNKIGYLFSPAIIGPLTLAGKTIQDVVWVADGGRLLLNKDMVDFFGDKKDFLQTFAGKEVELPAAGRGCPVAYKGKDIEVSGINMLSQTFMKVFEHTT